MGPGEEPEGCGNSRATVSVLDSKEITCVGSLRGAAERPARQWRKPADAFAEGISKVFARATCYER